MRKLMVLGNLIHDSLFTLRADVVHPGGFILKLRPIDSISREKIPPNHLPGDKFAIPLLRLMWLKTPSQV